MSVRAFRICRWILAVGTCFFLAFPALSQRDKVPGRQFKYTGGTESVHENCEGNLELSSTTLTFECESGSVAVPYSSISLMQYRPDVSRQVWKMKLKWKLKPPNGGGKQNRYFAVVYKDEDQPHALVLEVRPRVMRPYLAEIDLKTGKRVEVKSFEDYD